MVCRGEEKYLGKEIIFCRGFKMNEEGRYLEKENIWSVDSAKYGKEGKSFEKRKIS